MRKVTIRTHDLTRMPIGLYPITYYPLDIRFMKSLVLYLPSTLYIVHESDIDTHIEPQLVFFWGVFLCHFCYWRICYECC